MILITNGSTSKIRPCAAIVKRRGNEKKDFRSLEDFGSLTVFRKIEDAFPKQPNNTWWRNRVLVTGPRGPPDAATLP